MGSRTSYQQMNVLQCHELLIFDQDHTILPGNHGARRFLSLLYTIFAQFIYMRYAYLRFLTVVFAFLLPSEAK